MQRYWVRIALGALAVFAVGMVGISVARSGMKQLEAVANSTRPIGIPLALLPFRLDGEQLGTVRRLELIRSAPKKVTGIRLTVALQDSSDADHLRDCNVTVHAPVAFGGRDGFSCSTTADSAAGHLERIGEIIVEPGGLVRAIFARAEQASEWRASLYDTGTARAELAALKAERLADSTARAVIIRADSSRAVIDIRGDSARPIVQVQADSRGALLRVQDRSGKEIVRLRANSDGASLSVTPDSSPDHSKH